MFINLLNGGEVMKVKELIAKLSTLDQDDEIVITVMPDEVVSDFGAYEPDVIGLNGWDNVAEIGLGELISG